MKRLEDSTWREKVALPGQPQRHHGRSSGQDGWRSLDWGRWSAILGHNFIPENKSPTLLIWGGVAVKRRKREEWVFIFPFPENKDDKKNSEQA